MHAGLSEKSLANIFQTIRVSPFLANKMMSRHVCLASLHASMVNYYSQTLQWSPQPIITSFTPVGRWAVYWLNLHCKPVCRDS